MQERQSRIDKFNGNKKYFCFLLTTQVGGVGLNLTGANRVIIVDPSWNNIDDQVVDRAYRIGQTKNVIIYRLITCGTIEEKMYRKQVYKASLSHSMTQKDQKHHRYFTSTELSELYRLDDPRKSQTQKMLQKLHSHKRKKRESLDLHIEWLSSLDIFGISDHDLLFSEHNEKVESDISLQVVKEKVKTAAHKLHTSNSQTDHSIYTREFKRKQEENEQPKKKPRILTLSNEDDEEPKTQVFEIDSDDDDDSHKPTIEVSDDEIDDDILNIEKPYILIKSPPRALEEISEESSHEDLPLSNDTLKRKKFDDDTIEDEQENNIRLTQSSGMMKKKPKQLEIKKPEEIKKPDIISIRRSQTSIPNLQNSSFKDVFTSKPSKFIDLT